MEERNIFNSSLEMDCFCLDIAEAWIKYRKNSNQKVSRFEFEDWIINELNPALDYNFGDVFEAEFGYRDDEYEED